MTSLSAPADHDHDPDPDRETGDLAVEGGVTGRDDAGPYVRLVVTREQVDWLAEAGYAVAGVGGHGLTQDFENISRAATIAEVRPDP